MTTGGDGLSTSSGTYPETTLYDPDFLSFVPDTHEPNLYLNAVIGIIRKYYDMKVLQALLTR